MRLAYLTVLQPTQIRLMLKGLSVLEVWSKERLTIALCASAMGEKMTPLLIGRSVEPRCFKNIDPWTLALAYFSN